MPQAPATTPQPPATTPQPPAATPQAAATTMQAAGSHPTAASNHPAAASNHPAAASNHPTGCGSHPTGCGSHTTGCGNHTAASGSHPARRGDAAYRGDANAARKHSPAGWLMQAQQFYANALSDAAILAKLATYGQALKQLTLGQAGRRSDRGAHVSGNGRGPPGSCQASSGNCRG